MLKKLWILLLLLCLAAVPALADEIPVALSGEGDVTLTEGGTYRLTGTLTGCVTVSCGEENVELILNSVTITNADGPCILLQECGDTVLRLPQGSASVLTSGTACDVLTQSPAEDADGAAILAHCDLSIRGSGALTVNGYLRHGIQSTKDLEIRNGTLTVQAAGQALRGRNSVTVSGGTLVLTAGGDAIHAASAEKDGKGYVLISGGDITITCTGDGVQAAADISVTGGSVSILAGGGSTAVTKSTDDGWGGGRSRGRGWDWDDWYGDTASDGSAVSAKGLKATDSISISDGSVTVNSADDAIHAENGIVISGGILTLATGDDGIHGGTSLSIMNGTVTVTDSYEGL